MKTDIEYELLNIRQSLREAMNTMLDEDVVDISSYREIYVKWYTCNRMLRYYRTARRRAI